MVSLTRRAGQVKRGMALAFSYYVGHLRKASGSVSSPVCSSHRLKKRSIGHRTSADPDVRQSTRRTISLSLRVREAYCISVSRRNVCPTTVNSARPLAFTRRCAVTLRLLSGSAFHSLTVPITKTFLPNGNNFPTLIPATTYRTRQGKLS